MCKLVGITPLIFPIFNLHRENGFSEEEVQGLGELGVVTGVEFDPLERNDTGQYTCTATNSLPGGQTGDLRANPVTIRLTVLGWYLEYLQHL